MNGAETHNRSKHNNSYCVFVTIEHTQWYHFFFFFVVVVVLSSVFSPPPRFPITKFYTADDDVKKFPCARYTATVYNIYIYIRDRVKRAVLQQLNKYYLRTISSFWSRFPENPPTHHKTIIFD